MSFWRVFGSSLSKLWIFFFYNAYRKHQKMLQIKVIFTFHLQVQGVAIFKSYFANNDFTSRVNVSKEKEMKKITTKKLLAENMLLQFPENLTTFSYSRKYVPMNLFCHLTNALHAAFACVSDSTLKFIPLIVLYTGSLILIYSYVR